MISPRDFPDQETDPVVRRKAREFNPAETAHDLLTHPDGLSLIICSTGTESAEALRRVRDILFQAGARLKVDDVHILELENGSRLEALPFGDGPAPRRGRRNARSKDRPRSRAEGLKSSSDGDAS